MSESTIEVEATEQDGADVDAHFEEVGQRIRCNSCGFEKLRSEPGGCPEGHVAGWSYVPPDAEASPESADLPEVVPAGDDDGAESEVEPEPEAVPETSEAYENRPTGDKWAIQQIIDQNNRVIRQGERVNSMNLELNGERQLLKEMQGDLNKLITEAEKAQRASEPDPKRYPLLDGPKAEINSMFAKPESIPPLPADTEEEFFRRKGRDTRLADMGLPKRVVTAMEKGGYVTFADVGKLTEASAPLTSVKGVGEEAAGQIMDALATEAQKWADEWKATHPEPAEPETEVEGA